MELSLKTPPGEVLAAFLEQNRARWKTNRAFAEELGKSEVWLSRLLRGGQCSPKAAIQIHVLSAGQVPGSVMRPDLWREPSAVPTPKAG